MHTRTHVASTLAGIALIAALLASCSNDGTSDGAQGSDQATTAPGPTATDGSTPVTTTGEDASTDDLEQSEVDPCVVEPDELRSFVESNNEVIGPVRNFGPGVPADGRDPECAYEDLWEEDTGGPTYFTVTARRAEFMSDTADQWCIVVHRGICLSIGNRSGEGDDPLTPPPAETLQAIKDRLDQG